MSHIQTCQPPVKENLETHEKKSGDSTKNRELDTNLIPRAYSPFKMADTWKIMCIEQKQKSRLGTKK